MTTLGELKVGDQAKMTGFGEGGGNYRRKLLALGFVPGVGLEIVRVAPMGDPVEIRLRGFNMSLRKDEAAVINVEKL